MFDEKQQIYSQYLTVYLHKRVKNSVFGYFILNLHIHLKIGTVPKVEVSNIGIRIEIVISCISFSSDNILEGPGHDFSKT